MTRRLIRAALATLAVSVAGCGPAVVASPGPTASPSPAATAAATGTPTASPPPAVTQRFSFDKDVVVTRQLAGSTDIYINPGAVIEEDGILHMFPNLFSRWPGRVRVPHLTSTDGLAWTLDEATAPLDSEDVMLADPGMDVSTGFIANDGTWVLIYQTVSSTAPGVLARATAPGPTGPWTVEDTPILTEGSAAAFDHGGLSWPSAVKIGERWAIYYTGDTALGARKTAIGVAFSDDGVTWTKQAEPVLEASESWELGSLDRPRVVQTPTGLVMVYAGLDLNKRALATSTDGIAWTKVPGPNLEQADFPIVDAGWDAAVLYRGGKLEYFLEIGFQTTDVYRATLAWP